MAWKSNGAQDAGRFTGTGIFWAGRVMAVLQVTVLLAGLPAVLLGTPLWAQAGSGASKQADEAGCVPVQHGLYQCNLRSFERRLAAATTVAVRTRAGEAPMDRFTQRQTRELATSLGKSVVGPGTPSDLIFLVKPADAGAITMGPADRPLATLQVYAGGGGEGGGHASLLWSETYSGQGDRPWAAVVAGLIEQFKGRLGRR